MSQLVNKNRATIFWWLDSIRDEQIRQRALVNLLPKYKNYQIDSLPDALISAFSWCNAPEGFDFWNEVERTYIGASGYSIGNAVEELCIIGELDDTVKMILKNIKAKAYIMKFNDVSGWDYRFEAPSLRFD